jgi:hypothetical protein
MTVTVRYAFRNLCSSPHIIQLFNYDRALTFLPKQMMYKFTGGVFFFFFFLYFYNHYIILEIEIHKLVL